jgi:hypothetical protein
LQAMCRSMQKMRGSLSSASWTNNNEIIGLRSK